ncbi:MAG: (5-formylfuran-3-yl)methyl phosphate synthase [Planctomycetales bacterium]|nr:(5-formylfuran-3-yl)methyl phosphate synthase [Planctomycetales bacterium]
MKILASVINVAEAQTVLSADVDVLDVKNPAEGSLGAAAPTVCREIAAIARRAQVPVSVALGDLEHQPGTAAWAALGAATLGADYIKLGLRGSTTARQARQMMQAVREAVPASPHAPAVVACGYADYGDFSGLSLAALTSAAAESGCDYVMLDTLVKDGRSLFDHLAMETLREFILTAHSKHLRVALAGSLKQSHLPRLAALAPDLIGVRGALCANGQRSGAICLDATRAFLQAARAAHAELGGNVSLSKSSKPTSGAHRAHPDSLATTGRASIAGDPCEARWTGRCGPSSDRTPEGGTT